MQNAPRWSQPLERMVLWIVLAIEMSTFVMVGAVLISAKAPSLAILISFIAIAAPLSLLMVARLGIRLETNRLRWSFFPIWRGSVRYDDIEGVSVERVDAMRDFTGWGVRLKRHAYGAIARSGPAVRIQRRSKKRDLVLTCDEAEELAEALRSLVAHPGHGREA